MVTTTEGAATAPTVDEHRGTPAPRWAAVLVAIGVPVVVGIATALVMPRGPVTPMAVTAAMLLGAATGFATGVLLGSRWAMLGAPLAFVVALEIARLPVVGPSVDAPRVDTVLGVLALVLGRGWHGLVQLLPMVVGAAWGAAMARRRAGSTRSSRRWVRVAGSGLSAAAAAGLAALAALMWVPGRTAPITDVAGEPVAGSVAEITTVTLGGADQKVLLRARDADAPVLLYLAGGPGQSDLGYVRAYLDGLEDDVVLAVWDQRGTGTSYAALDPAETWTPEQAVADTLELTDYLRDRFDEERIYLFGNSWGSALGVMAVQERPEAFHAFIGAGQMVSMRETDRLLYEDMLEYAARTGDEDLADRMRGFGEPPYEDMNAYAVVLGYYDRLEPYDRTEHFLRDGPAGIDGTGAEEYGPLDKVNKEKALLDMAAVLYPQLQDVDFRRDVERLEVPVYLVQGAHELTARSSLASEWFAQLDAPVKRWIEFGDSGHVPQFEESARFRDILRDTVIADTYPG